MMKKCVFWANTLIRQSKKGKHVVSIELMANKKNPHLCVVSILKEYLHQTKDIRDIDQLFISYQKPHHPVSTDTLAHWIRDTLIQ